MRLPRARNHTRPPGRAGDRQHSLAEWRSVFDPTLHRYIRRKLLLLLPKLARRQRAALHAAIDREEERGDGSAPGRLERTVHGIGGKGLGGGMGSGRRTERRTGRKATPGAAATPSTTAGTGFTSPATQSATP